MTNSAIILFALFAVAFTANAFNVPDAAPDSDDVVFRQKRSWAPGGPDYSQIARDQAAREAERNRNHGVNVDRDDRGNTRVSGHTRHQGDGYEVNAEASRVIRGPDRGKPNWRVGVQW
uniref:Coleoptericin n=1 Tax=Lasioderma serricorne TaxID=295660 RepID=A0A8A4XEU8_9COLE|nr:coleoptericin [Lasioderma serricorne]